MRRAWTIGPLALAVLGCGGSGGGSGSFGASPVGFAAVATTSVLGNPLMEGIAVGYFDADPWPDVAVGHSGDGEVSILFGRGNGRFDAATPITAGLPGTHSTFVRAAFLNLDAFTDLVVVDRDIARAQVFLGNGDGTFDPVYATALDISPSDTRDVQVGRLNDDVLDDVVFVTPAGVHVYLAIGNGFLATASGSPYFPAADIETATIGQVGFSTFAGPLDLILCSPDTGMVHVLEGDGFGGFAAAPFSPVLVAEVPVRAVTASIDGQSSDDLVVLTGSPVGVRVFLGDGGSNLVPTAAGHLGIVGDAGMDAHVVFHPQTGHDDVLLLTADATFEGHLTRIRPHDDTTGAVTRTSTTLSGYAKRFAVFDMDQDGHDDLILPYVFPTAGLLEVRFGP